MVNVEKKDNIEGEITKENQRKILYRVITGRK
jgi:hypothetical protein